MDEAIRKLVFGHMQTVNGPYQTAQISDHVLHCLLTESLYRHYRIMSGKQRPGCYFTHVQDDLNLQRFDGTFSLDMVCMQTDCKVIIKPLTLHAG